MMITPLTTPELVDEEMSITIEFRQHAGTFDADKIDNCVTLVTRLVEVTRCFGVEDLEACLLGVVEREDDGQRITTSQFTTRFLGLPEVAEYYEEEKELG
jgi:hypothetical protein